MKKICACALLLILLHLKSQAQSVVINEIQSSNWGIISAAGKYEDWIEFKNKTASAVNLNQYYLSNDRLNLKKWRFPTGTTIPAGGYLVVFASGNNRIISGKIHTNFTLKSSGSDIFMSDTTGKLIDQHEAGGITSKTSWARVPDGSVNWCILGVPTPGATNGNGSCITQFAPPPVVSVKPGIYPGRINIIVTCPDSGTFRYTLDGKTPTASVGILKTSGSVITLDSSKVLKIRTLKAGKHISNIWMGTYLIKQPNITLPIISIGVNPDSASYLITNIDKINEKEGYIQYLDKKGNLLTQFGANLTIHGNYSSTFPQKSFRIETRSWLDSSDINFRLYGNKKIYNFKNFNLRNAGVDWMRGHIRDFLTCQLMPSTDNDYSAGKQVLVYLNGSYYGLGEIREKIDNDFCAENHDIDPDSIDMLSYSGTINHGSDSAWNGLRNQCNALNLAIDSNFNKVAKYIDLDNWIDYFATQIYIGNTDWPGNNIKWWRPQRKEGKWRYILWDLDFGWGIPWSSGTIPVTQDNLPGIVNGSLPVASLFKNAGFRRKFINRYADLMNTIFRYEVPGAGNVNVFSLMKSYFDTLDKEMPRAFSRWPNPGASVSGASSSYNDWKQKYGDMLIWARDRPKNARIHVKNSFSSTTSDTVSITFTVSPAGAGRIRVNSIYPNIGTGWKGTYYKGVPVTVTAIPNPGYTFQNWNINNADTNPTTSKDFTTAQTVTAYFTATSTIETPKLAVTEINYNSHKSINSGNWFELKNYGKSPVNMTGWVMETQTIWKKYKFPDQFVINPSEYIVFCNDTQLFRQFHKDRNYRLIPLPFTMDNSAEQLELKDPAGKTYINISWTNDFPWPLTADGHGRTMELVADTSDPSNSNSWYNGCMLGSPGKPWSPCTEKLRVSEINYNPTAVSPTGDWFEIYNNKTDTLKLGNWKFHSKDAWNIYSFPTNFNILPGQRVVIAGDSAGFRKVHPGVTNKFIAQGLNLRNSEDVIDFYSPDDTLRFSVGYADNEPFPFKADGKGYTIDLKDSVKDMSSGISWRSVCLDGSPGISSNACEGGIIISEINYKSASFQDAGDWFEIHNTGNTAFNMGGWTVTDDTTNLIYIIPANTILPAYGYLVFVSDTVKFKKLYPSVKNYLGNFKFGLGSTDDQIRLYNVAGTPVNAMKYGSSAPWPVNVAGRGYSIELTDSDAWLSDGSKWRRSGCMGGSPGGPNTNCYDSVWIAEFNYNSASRADAGDWVELWNAGNKTVDISNWLFSDSDPNDTFIIQNNTILQPKQRLVLASSISKLYKLHDTIVNVQGNFKFGLSSKGDALVLRDTSGRLKFGMEYNTDSTWNNLADGRGYTLTLIRNRTDFISSNTWTTACPTGSPGTADGACKVDLAVTEINYYAEPGYNTGDWIELLNTGKIPVDLYNYRLQGIGVSDYFYLPKIDLIYPGERLVLVNDSVRFDRFHPGIRRQGNFSFDLKQDTGTIALFDLYGNNVAPAYYASRPLWPQGAYGMGKTLERKAPYINAASPLSWFDGCIGGSPGKSFSPCKDNPVVSEVNYNPGNSLNTGQWIEIWNRSPVDTINLSKYILTNSQLSNSYIIPTGTVLYPGERLVVTADSNRFRRYFQGTKVIGNYFFLMGVNDRIRLFDSTGRIRYFMDYSSFAPWPQKANGNGYTLEFNDTAYFYSQPGSWFSGCFGGSPGTAYQPCYSSIKLNEINYSNHPLRNSGNWVEFYNFGSGYINLQGSTLSNFDSSLAGIINRPIILAPKSYILLVSDSSRFDQINPGLFRVGGLFQLNDTGDVLKLYDMDKNLMASGAYSKSSPWPEGGYKTGRTLERESGTNSGIGPNDWFAGCLGGSPGRAYSWCNEPIVFSEINYQSHPKANAGDWMEILNRSSQPVDLSSWRLLSNDSTRIHYINNGAVLWPGERYILYQNPLLYKNIYGSLPAKGEQILFSLKGKDGFSLISNQTRLIYNNGWDSIQGWPQADGSSYTLEFSDSLTPVFSAGQWSLGCPAGSPGTGLLPCQGSISVSEINPSSEQWVNSGDWLELQNIQPIPVKPTSFSLKISADTLAHPLTQTSLLFQGDKYLVASDTSAFFKTAGIRANDFLPKALSNLADTIQLYNDSSRMIQQVIYDKSLPNMKGAFETGRTLEVIKNSDPQWVGAWYAGCLGGSPGSDPDRCRYPLILTEISHTEGSTLPTGKWIEIKNTSPTLLDMEGYKIRSGGIDYSIKGSLKINSGERVILATDTAAFHQYWRGVASATQIGGMMVAPSGRLGIFDSTGRVLYYLDYDSLAPWPAVTQMPGRTLELPDSAMNIFSETSWIAGCYGGTPGRAFSLPCDYYGLGIMPVSTFEKYSVYPNPTLQQFTIEGTETLREGEAQLLDGTGKILVRKILQGRHQIGFDLSTYSSGIYLVLLPDGVTLKVVKQ